MQEMSTPSESELRSGINIKDALNILSDRANGGGDNISSESNSIPDELKGMGQTIDIAEQMDFTKIGCGCANRGDGGDNSAPEWSLEEEEKHEVMKQERMKRGAAIQVKLESMNVTDLLGTIFGAQQERVVTYKIFEE